MHILSQIEQSGNNMYLYGPSYTNRTHYLVSSLSLTMSGPDVCNIDDYILTLERLRETITEDISSFRVKQIKESGGFKKRDRRLVKKHNYVYLERTEKLLKTIYKYRSIENQKLHTAFNIYMLMAPQNHFALNMPPKNLAKIVKPLEKVFVNVIYGKKDISEFYQEAYRLIAFIRLKHAPNKDSTDFVKESVESNMNKLYSLLEELEVHILLDATNREAQ